MAYKQELGDLKMDKFYHDAYSMPISNGYTSYQIHPFHYKQEAELQRNSAQQGDPPSQLNIGFMYYMGMGVERNYAEALKWHRRRRGHRGGLRWYRLAVQGGYADTETKIGKLSDE